MEKFLDLIGDFYWNPLDWVPWIGVQFVFAALIGGIFQWWFKRGAATFLIVLTISFSTGFAHLPKPLLSSDDIIRMNAKLPEIADGLTLTSIAFSHRYLTYKLSSEEGLDQTFFDNLEEQGLFLEGCKILARWLSTRQIKRVEFVFSWPGGGQTKYMQNADCQLLPAVAT